MKELSIEEKAKAYDEAIKVAKSKIKNNKDHVFYEEDITDILSELKESKESEDDKILRFINNCMCFIPDEAFVNNGITKHDYLSWLEKQCKQKEGATRYKIAEYLKNLILDQSQRGAPMLYYEGRIEEEADFIISIAKKELKKIEQESFWCGKDDITRINEIIETLNIVQANRVRTQRMHYNKATIDKNIAWLKSLKDRVGCEANRTTTKEWKPTKEQMNALKWVLSNMPYCNHKEEINGLLEQLEQL